jgi:hypothetical protein
VPGGKVEIIFKLPYEHAENLAKWDEGARFLERLLIVCYRRQAHGKSSQFGGVPFAIHDRVPIP